MSTDRPRKTNLMRPLCRIGWAVIWGAWVFAVLELGPSSNNSFARIVFVVVVTVVAWVLQRLWDLLITGKPLQNRKNY